MRNRSKVIPWGVPLLALILIAGSLATAQSPNTRSATKRLQLGSYAPGIQFELVQKGPVALKNGWKGRVHIVEFWATWCGPCRHSAPHLTDLQKRYGKDGLVILGISDERANEVTKFAKEMGRGMDYNLAIDPSRKTHREWMGSFGVSGIPHAFLVGRDGRIAWHGHPMNPDMETQIKKLLNQPPPSKETDKKPKTDSSPKAATE